MSRTKKIAILAIVIMVLTMLPVQMFAATTAADSTRLYGAGRVETSLQVCDAGWTTASTVIVAPADQANLVDALAAAPLAGQENAPILLTFKTSLDAAVKAKIAALGATKVYAVGALSDSVKDEIAGISGVTVEALKGDSRWDTTKAINAKLVNPAGTFVVGYAALADALSVSAYAAANKYAVVLADVNGAIPAGQSAVGSKTYLVGGSGLVAEITGATRIAGADRFETNKKVLETLTFDYAKVYVANGFNNHLVDSLVAAPLAAQLKAPILLADNSGIAAKEVVNAKLTSTSTVVALGGASVVSDSVRDNVKYNAPAEFAVESLEVVSLNTVKVVFNQKVNETDAESTANYTLGTTALGAGDCAVLQSDGKTVLVTVGTPTATINQNSKYTFKVKSGLLNDEGDQTSKKFEQELKFSDITSPTVTKATASGNKKVKVYFSEPVLQTVASLGTGIKLDGYSLSSQGAGTITAKDSREAGGPTAGASGDQGADAVAGGATIYASMLEIPFNVSLAAGTHTLTVPNGTAGSSYMDLAGFRVDETTIEFTVESVTGAPEVKAIEASNNGTVYVEFNRDMDTTAGTNGVTNTANFSINGNAPTQAKMVTSRDDKVKLTFASGVVASGANVLVIDKDIKDAFGNKLHGSDDQRYSFSATSDSEKPTVTSVHLTGNETTGAKITVKFSEDVSALYASNASSYKLKDSDGDTVASAAADFASILNKDGSSTSNSDTWILTIAAAKSPLTDSSYTLEVKDIVDLAKTPNRMDTVTMTLTVGDTVKPYVVTNGIWESSVNANKVIVEFSESMDSSVLELTNYYWQDGTSAWNSLPSGTTITKDSDKRVQIKFPNGVAVTGSANAGLATDVVKLRVTNVKDIAGNALSGGSAEDTILECVAGPAVDPLVPTITIEPSSLVVKKVGDDAWVTFQTSEPLSTLSTTEVKYAGQAANSYVISGKEVTLKYTTSTPTALAAVKAAGGAGTLITSSTGAAGGAVLASTYTAEGKFLREYDGAPNATLHIYDDQIAPELLDIAFTGAGTRTVDIWFSEDIDDGILGLYKDDFTFESAGSLLTVQSVAVSANAASKEALTYTFSTAATDIITVRAVADKIDIKDVKEGSAYKNDQNAYAPTSDDKGANYAYDNITDASIIATLGAAPAGNATKPHIIKAAKTESAAATGVAADWDEIGDTLTLTFSENVTVALTAGTVAVGAAGQVATAAEVAEITGIAVVYGAGSTVTVTHPTANTIVLTIGAVDLGTGIVAADNINGTAGTGKITDAQSNNQVASAVNVNM